MKIDESDVAVRFSRLPLEKQKIFLHSLKTQGIDFGRLPIVATRSNGANNTDYCAPGSYAQMRQWFLWQLEPRSTAYHISSAFRLHGDLNRVALQESFDAMLMRHASLRTIFRLGEHGEIEQLVLAHAKVQIDAEDVGNVPFTQREARVREAALRMQQMPFDLEKGPLLRVGLIRAADDDHVLVVVMHHIISDDWSMQIIASEFSAQYSARAHGLIAELAPLPIQYVDYASWQRNWLDAGEKERQLAYWRSQLGDTHPILQLPLDYPRKADGAYGTMSHSIELPAALAQGLRKLAQSEDTTLFIVLLAGVQALLHRYSGQDDIRVGVPIANRQRVETEMVVGFFINTQVLRNRVDSRKTLAQILAQTKAAALGAQLHQDLPFEQLVEALQPERSFGINPLFQVMFNHLPQDAGVAAELPGLRLEDYPLGEEGAQFELSIDSSENRSGEMRINFTYAKELFAFATIDRMSRHLQSLLWAFARASQQVLGDVELLADELQQLQQWGAITYCHPCTDPIHKLIEARVQQSPQATALIFDDCHLSYGELNARANRLARRLIHLGVKLEAKIGIAIERSPDMIVGLLAILKAGAAYVPLDPSYPPERIAFMVEDSGIEFLLTHGAIRQRIPISDSVEVLEIDAIDLSAESAVNPDVGVHAENLAYVIYTSGSTGKPKGAQLNHRNVTRLLGATAASFNFSPDDIWTLFHSYAFDFSVWEIFGALCTGGQLVIVPFWTSRSPEDFLQLLRKHRVTILNQTPSAFGQLMAVPGIHDEPLALRAVIFGGEALDPQRLRSWIAHRGDQTPRLINMYGITETTVHVTCRQITAADLHAPCSPVGAAIPDLGLRVLDVMLNLTPIGVPGELFVAGDGLARGYLNRPALSAQRFVADPFGNDGARLYRTGDLVRWNEQGQLEYLGRIDDQVKVRGFRIELGEVEARLLSQPIIREAVVVAVADAGETRLVAYVSAAPGLQIDMRALREKLSGALPEHMLPAAIIVLDSLPLNANGKVDRKMLPAPRFESGCEYEAPRDDMERAMAAIWSEVLGVDRIGRHDNFFELGGHSISALRVVNEVRRSLPDLQITLKDMLSKPTLHALSCAPRQMILLNRDVPAVAPLFCIHSGLGTVLGYLSLANRLNGARPVYGLASRTLVDPQHRDDSLETMADRYVEMICRVRSDAPYHLLGWSLGSVLAGLIAARLEASGKQVAFLGLVDPPVPLELVQDAVKIDWRTDYVSLLERVGNIRKGSLQVSVQATDPQESEQSLIDWTRVLMANGQLLPTGPYEGLAAEDLARTCLIGRNLTTASQRFSGTMPAVKALVHCWSAAARPEDNIAAALDQVVGGNVRHYRVDADHESIIQHPLFLETLYQSLSN